MSPQQREAFLADLHVGILSVERVDGPPLSVPIWYDYEPQGDVTVIAGRDSLKTVLLSRAGRFSLCAQNESLPYKYVTVEGPVNSVETADAEADLLPMATRYLGADGGRSYVDGAGGSDSVIIRMRPNRWFSVDYGA
ncbi:MAG: pyridoxamine 5'-phosphate oxidase [Actinomycetia bacterium]|nr:pyridoxamine 5'-phosphate oxidase [Actinomycetes bacterium]MCP3909327.1 pyridoxamine 5'-phosphate oxidase [Actinomycetes bacterium]MCP4087715.1 pyridoxamine 5'-phosphate oxidase [Actinomycetes bacterium]